MLNELKFCNCKLFLTLPYTDYEITRSVPGVGWHLRAICFYQLVEPSIKL